MRYFYLAFLLSWSFIIVAQENPATPNEGKAPYHLAIPANWHTERFSIPISFAPGIPYHGVEDIRFAPGWAKPGSEQYWTYAFLWYIDDSVNTNAATISDHLQEYFTGLNAANSDTSKTGTINFHVSAKINITATSLGDISTFSGSVDMRDYMQDKPMKLNVKVHIRYCKAENKSAIFYQLSPQPFSHSNWSDLDELWAGFRCKR